MYRLFEGASPTSVGVRDYPNFRYEKSITERNVQKYIDYRRNSVSFVDTDHLLIKILMSLGVSYTGNDVLFTEQVAQRVRRVEHGFGLTSYANRGRVHQGVFFNGRGHEIILLANSPVPGDIASCWEDVSPLRVLSHARSDLSIETFDGKGNEPEVGLSVIALDLPLLALQWEYWKQSVYAGKDEQHRSYSHFLYQFPLTNLVKSFLDVSLINRFYRRVLGAVGSTYLRKQPVYLTDNSVGVDKVLDEVTDRLFTKQMDFEDMARNIPAFFGQSALETVRVKNIPYTQQAIWALMAARVEIVSAMLFISDATGNARTRDEVTQIKRDLIRAQSGKLLSNGLPSNVAKDLSDRLATQINPYL